MIRWIGILAVCAALHADMASTREVLGSFSGSNEVILESYERLAPNVDERVLAALEFAAEKHEGQARKNVDRTPYIIHPLGVCELLWTVGGVRDSDVLIAALLHDTLEDTETVPEEIRERFGDRVLEMVLEVTNDPNLSSVENKRLQVKHAPHMSQGAKLVKLADRLYNVTDALISPPQKWTQKNVDAYVWWAETLGVALLGTEPDLEARLQVVLAAHREGKELVEAYLGELARGTRAGAL